MFSCLLMSEKCVYIYFKTWVSPKPLVLTGVSIFDSGEGDGEGAHPSLGPSAQSARPPPLPRVVPVVRGGGAPAAGGAGGLRVVVGKGHAAVLAALGEATPHGEVRARTRVDAKCRRALRQTAPPLSSPPGPANRRRSAGAKRCRMPGGGKRPMAVQNCGRARL